MMETFMLFCGFYIACNTPIFPVTKRSAMPEFRRTCQGNIKRIFWPQKSVKDRITDSRRVEECSIDETF